MNIKMIRNENKIIRAVTVSQSLGFCREIMIKMRDMGYEMIAVSSPGKELDIIKEQDSIPVYAVPMARHISLKSDLVSLFNMVKVFRREKPYVVHSMTPKAGLICMMAGWLTGIPVRLHTFTGLVWPTSKGIKRKVLMMTDRLTCACATHIIPEGQGVLNDLKNGRITRKPMKVLGYGNVRGVDMNQFNPARFDVEKSDKFTFLFVGRIVGDKGINELVEAFTRLCGEYHNVQLLLVGNYETDLDPVTQLTQERIKANPVIHADGPLHGDDLLKEYVKADCFVMPSYREGFPNTVLEAGAMGLPSIVTDINGSREIIVNGKNGLIVPSKDANALYEAMKSILNDEEMRKQMAVNARPMIESRFEKNYVQKCLMDFYEVIMN